MTTTKRTLRLDEIEYLVSGIEPIQHTDVYLKRVTDNKHANLIARIQRDLLDVQVYPSIIDELKQSIEQQYYSSQVQAGDTVGIIMAQSIGERQTQLALNSFHSTGITTLTVVTGVPRFTELINTTKKPRNVMTTIYCNGSFSSIESIRLQVGVHLRHVLFGDLIVYHEFHPLRPKDTWYRLYTALVRPLPALATFVRFKLNHQVLFENHLSVQCIAERMERQWPAVQCVYSPMTEAIIDVWFTGSRTDAETVIVPTARKLTVNGIPHITELNYTTTQTGEWYIEALGQNLQTVMGHPAVDETRTFSNNMWEIHDYLGAEATREFLVRELMNVISVDAYINKRHVDLLVDLMLATGTLTSISRYGIQRTQIGPLAACSFEESLDQFLQAGLFGEKDPLTSVSASIICGKMSRSGTGMCDLMFKSDQT
jgi:RNA polymerase Rpb1, domain 5